MKKLILALAVAGATLAFAGTAKADWRDDVARRGGQRQWDQRGRYDRDDRGGWDRGRYQGYRGFSRSEWGSPYRYGYNPYNYRYGGYGRPGFSLQFNFGR